MERGSPELPVATSIAVGLAAVVLLGAMTGPFLHVYRLSSAVATGNYRNYERIEFGPFADRGGVFPELIDYLRPRTGLADVILLWGSAAGVNYLE